MGRKLTKAEQRRASYGVTCSMVHSAKQDALERAHELGTQLPLDAFISTSIHAMYEIQQEREKLLLKQRKAAP